MADGAAVAVEQSGTIATSMIENFPSRGDGDGAAAEDHKSGGTDVAPGGNSWDGEKWVNTAARDEKGRFAKVRESLALSQKKSAFVRDVLDGVVEPDEAHDPETWRAAREAQLARGTHKITPPDFPEEEKAGKSAAGDGKTGQQELSPEEIKHFEAHDTFLSSVAAKIAVDPDTKTALEGFQQAADKGATYQAIAYLGHVISDTPNAHEVFMALGKNPDAIAMYTTRLSPQGMAQAVQELSRQIAARSSEVVQKPSKPRLQFPLELGQRLRLLTRTTKSLAPMNGENEEKSN
jgi:hypothetical protein